MRRFHPIFHVMATAVIVAAMLSGCVHSTRRAFTPETRQKQTASFEQVWSTVRDKNWDTTYNGQDWQAVYDRYLPRIEQARDIEEVRAAIREMLSLLGQSHCAIIPAAAYSQMASMAPAEDAVAAEIPPTSTAPPKPPRDGSVGLSCLLVEGVMTIVKVEEGSPAREAGVMPGWTIDRVDGDAIKPMVKELRAAIENPSMLDLTLAKSVQARFDQPIGATVKARFRDGAGKAVNLKLASAVPRGEDAGIGNIPPIPVWFESRMLEGGVGYIAFSNFLDPLRLMPAYEKAMLEFAGARGVIIDLRGNTGGIAGMAMGMAGWFVDTPDTFLGTMTFRDGELRLAVNPRRPFFGGPVAVLVDGVSASCSEIFAGGLRDVRHARLFGATTAGAALPAAIERLPNGDGFMYPVADYVSRNGARFEGEGVKPDMPVTLTRQALLDGSDPVLEAAMEWLNTDETNE